MTKKHFQAIADTVKALMLTNTQKYHVAVRFSLMLAEQNPRFDKDRFIRACGVES